MRQCCEIQQLGCAALELRFERVDVPDVDVLEAEVLELHGGQLKDQLGLTALVLEADLFDLTQDKRLHLDRMEAEAPGELKAAFEWDDASFEDVATREAFIDLRIHDRVGLVGEQVLDDQALAIPGDALQAEDRVDRRTEV